MRVLILGAQGMLGHALCWASAADDVLAWDREDLDITRAPDVEKRLAAARPDVVMNAAAYTDVEGAETQTELAESVNGYAVGHLAATCAQHGIPLLHISTDYVFSGTAPDGYAEDDAPDEPGNAYGRSKLLGEQLLRSSRSDFWLVRTSWLYGPSGKNFVDTMLRLGAERRELRVIADQRGSPTYTRDLAQVIVALVRDRAPFGVYHLTNSGTTTWAEFARDIFMSSGLDVAVVPIASAEFPARARRPLRSVLKNTKRPLLRHWHEGLQDYLQFRSVPPS